MGELEPEVGAELSDEAHRARAAFELWIGHRNDLRAAARRLGYALALHGSVKRDVDLVAFPWVEDAAAPDDLAEALLAAMPRGSHLHKTAAGAIDWSLKPHGRRACTIHAPGEWYANTYLDLSVAPRLLGAGDP